MPTGIFSGDRTLYLLQAISIPWDGETKARPKEVTRDRARGAEPLPRGSHPPDIADSSGWQEGHGAESFEMLPKKQGTDVCYWIPFLSHKTLSFLPNIPEPQEKPGAEMRRRMSYLTLEMESSLLPPSLLLFEVSSLTQHPTRLDLIGPWPLGSSGRPWHPSGRRAGSS